MSDSEREYTDEIETNYGEEKNAPDGALIEIAARLNLYEFLFEVWLAKTFACYTEPEQAIEEFSSAFIEKIRHNPTPAADDKFSLNVQERMIELTEHFFVRLTNRATQIAAQTKAAQEANNADPYEKLNHTAGEMAERVIANMSDEEVRNLLAKAF